MSKFLDWLEEQIRYPWANSPKPSTSPMEGVYRKSYEFDDKKIMVFVLKDNPHSEVKFYINGNPVYTVSYGSFEDLLNGVVKAELEFKKNFLETLGNHKYVVPIDTPLWSPIISANSNDKLKSLGFK